AAGSTIGISGPSGRYLNSYSYSPFGGILTSPAVIPNMFLYMGKRGALSVDGGSIMMKFRTYDPQAGRFTEEDPIGLTIESNAYLYAANSPIEQSDPTGLLTPPEVAGGIFLNGVRGLEGILGIGASIVAFPFSGGASILPLIAA